MVAVLALSSAAFACTVYKGSMTVKQANSPAKQTVYGAGQGMNWCGGEPTWRLSTATNSVASIAISTGAYDCAGTGTKMLRNDTYNVGLSRFRMGQNGTPHTNCHFAITPQVLIGTYSVTDGAGGATQAAQKFDYVTNSLPGYDNICVFGTTSADANDINIAVI